MLLPHPFVPKLLDTLVAEVDEWGARRPSPSNISQCSRQHWFRVRRWRRTNLPRAGSVLAADEGWLVEPKVFSMLEKLGCRVERDVDCDWEFWRGDPGTPDGAIWQPGDSPQEGMIVDAKRLGMWSYISLLEKGLRGSKPEYYDQMQLYMTASGLKVALVVALCADPAGTGWVWKTIKKRQDELPPLWVEEVALDRERVNELCVRERWIDDMIEMVDEPARVTREFNPQTTNFPCNYCGWQDSCVEAGEQ